MDQSKKAAMALTEGWHRQVVGKRAVFLMRLAHDGTRNRAPGLLTVG